MTPFDFLRAITPYNYSKETQVGVYSFFDIFYPLNNFLFNPWAMFYDFVFDRSLLDDSYTPSVHNLIFKIKLYQYLQ